MIPLALGSVALAEEAKQARRLEGSRSIEGDEAPGYVAFTFDDGPDWKTTPKILDLLDEHGLKATFFVVGHRFSGKGAIATKNRAVLADILARGHLIGNHTFQHTNLRDTPLAEALADVDKNQRALVRHAGAGAVLFRPPFGALSDEIRAGLRRRKYVTVTWSVDSADTRSHKPERIRARVLAELLEDGGGVVLLHDTKPWTVEAFAGILEDLEAENCRRLGAGEPVLLPVELDHFARGENGDGLEIPVEVMARTEATRKRLETRCNRELDEAPASD